ncbi:GGDEF domain-containing protein [Halanaerobium kushneri]|uniref:PAS domain S-box-containing protein/diguanylate cyclase (GGDEF) domain-containing protein n=1 Tax=Halanaerobium kushneri TaxID=56779 RepID=A0A1N6U618_9FIRM|nr:diguanylate cyclase [Halanaerobium kushneri]SIQ61043.1 PAS domain S-box-containing protein/diguanylate cyclase (GGDEF) domain-containing protein [Halanaerobium kushneri]
MISKNQQNLGFIIKIDQDSQVQEVLFNSLNNSLNLENENFSRYVDQGSLKKYFSLLKEVKKKEVVFGREINLKLGEKSESYILIVLNNLDSSSILIAANQSEGIIKYYEELMRINNNYVNNLRRNLKEKIDQGMLLSEDQIYNEMSRLNNELVNLQRKLNKQNLLLKAEKEKYRVTLASIAEGVITADQDDLIVYLNSKAEDMLGWTLSQAKGKECTDIFKIFIEDNNEQDLDITAAEVKKAEEMDKAEENQDSLSIIFIDVNDLKLVNDNFGHQEGDELLQKISDILQHSLRRNDRVVRLGGDEFLLVLPHSNQIEAEKIWLRIRKEFRRATEANKKDYKISASHGAAEYSPDYQKDLEQLINEADNAMYKEKQKIKSAENIR